MIAVQSKRFVERLRGSTRRTVSLAEIQSAFRELFPVMADGLDARQMLLDLLEQAEGQQLLRINRSRTDTFSRPHLPMTVVLAADEDVRTRRRRVRQLSLRPELEWAAPIALDDAEAAFLSSVNAFLRDLDPAEPVIPMRERSLEIAEDEKRIQEMAAGRLFGPGRLTLDLLRCARTAPPLACADVGAGTRVLVVENQDTYWSLRRLLRPEHGYALLAYGSGNVFPASVVSLTDLRREFSAIEYFGDLDAGGLEIPRSASVRAIGAGLPAVTPAARLYELMLAHGKPQPDVAIDSAKACRLAAWLPEPMRETAIAMLVDGWRLAQERVGHKVLADFLGSKDPTQRDHAVH
jgi:Uncharacterized protein conserved in bacteria C-term(DUF2220)